MIGGRRLLVAVAGVVLVAACSPEPITNQVDGWATGAFLLECTDRLADADCASLVGPAMASIDDDRTARAVKVYEEGPYIDAGGSVALANRGSGPVRIVVVTYDDGARRAAGVYCGLTVEPRPAAPCEVVEPPFD